MGNSHVEEKTVVRLSFFNIPVKIQGDIYAGLWIVFSVTHPVTGQWIEPCSRNCNQRMRDSSINLWSHLHSCDRREILMHTGAICCLDITFLWQHYPQIVWLATEYGITFTCVKVWILSLSNTPFICPPVIRQSWYFDRDFDRQLVCL